MQIHSINNGQNNTNFGAKIKLKSSRIEQLLDYKDKIWANDVLNKFEAFHPDEVVEFYWLVKNNGKHNVLIANNTTTGVSHGIPIFPKMFETFNCMQNCDQFYSFLQDLMNPELYMRKHFWGELKEPKIDDLKKHSVFIV